MKAVKPQIPSVSFSTSICILPTRSLVLPQEVGQSIRSYLVFLPRPPLGDPFSQQAFRYLRFRSYLDHRLRSLL